jgi:CHASE1-domain containing sensor protein
MSPADKDSAPSPAIPRRIGGVLSLLAAGVVLLGSLGVTWYAWERVGADEAADRRMDLAYRARDAEARVARRMAAYEQVLRGTAALFTGPTAVARAEFRDYVTALRLEDHYPGGQGLGFALVVPAADLAAHTREVRLEGFPGYDVRPTGQRDPYTSILFLEPFSGRN